MLHRLLLLVATSGLLVRPICASPTTQPDTVGEWAIVYQPVDATLSVIQRTCELAHGLLARLDRDWRYQYRLGELDLRANHLDEADRRFRRSADLAPARAAGHVGLGLAAVARNRIDEAAKLFEHACKVEPGNACAAYNLGVCRMRQARFIDAESLFRRAIKLDDGHIQARHNLALICLHYGRLTDARDQWERVLQDEPRLTDARYSLAQTCFRLQDFHQAAEQARLILKDQPADADALNVLGLSLQALGRDKEAMAAFESAVRAAPTDPKIMCNLANLHVELYNSDRSKVEHARAALALWRRSLPTAPDPETIRKLIRVYSRLAESR